LGKFQPSKTSANDDDTFIFWFRDIPYLLLHGLFLLFWHGCLKNTPVCKREGVLLVGVTVAILPQ
jgi:hypothetical protein